MTTDLVKKSNLAEVGLIAVYLVQKNQFATQDEIIQLGKDKLVCELDKDVLDRALASCKKRGLIAEERRKVDKQSRKVYSLKNLSWKQPPEYAHVTDLLPVLLHTKELAAIKGWFDGKEDKGAAKRRRGNDIDNYFAFRVRAKTLDPLLGSQIKCDFTEQVKSEFPSDADALEVDGVWQRDELTGDYIIAPDIMQGWFITNACRYSGLPDARGTYLAFSPIRIRPNKPPYQYVLPVNSSKTGPAAPKPYEAIPAGQDIEINFLAPTKGGLSPEQYEKLFLIAGLRPRRGISPARGRRFGRFLVTSFETVGAVKEIGVDYLKSDIPEKILAEHQEYITDSFRRLANVNLSSTQGMGDEEEEEAPFPISNGASKTNGIPTAEA